MSLSPVADPEFLPFKLDLVGRRLLWVRMTLAQRREAAFLDERALQKGAEGGWMPLESLLSASTADARAADALFHIGHCGSTLLSRVLDGWNGMQSLREPLPLRTLAEAWPSLSNTQAALSLEQASKLLQALWSRWSHPLPPTSRVLVKASSSCNGLITPLLAQLPRMRAILLDQPLVPYLATLLKAPTSVLDAVHAANERLVNLQSRGFAEGVALAELSPPEQCAMGWLAERVRFGALALDKRVLRVSFETLLARPEPTLQSIVSHLGLDPGGLAAAMASPAWGRYSKAQSHAYSSEDRAHDLALAHDRQRGAIDAGVAWVQACLRRYPALQAFTNE